MAAARKNPPSMSQITLLEKVWAYLSMFSGSELKYPFPKENTRNAMMKRLTANAGIASVSHKPMAKNRRKRTYTWESVNPGSFMRKVIPAATSRDSRNITIFFSRFLSNSSILIPLVHTRRS